MLGITEAVQIIGQTTTIFWFRRDLRLEDNAGLYYALKGNTDVVPVFIFDTRILDKLDDKADARISFIHESIILLHEQLTKVGSSLLVLLGDPVAIFTRLKPKAVYTNHDYEPYARQRDTAVENILRSHSISFLTYKDQVIFDRNEVCKEDGKPYTIYTPYSKKWRSKLTDYYIKSYPIKKYINNLKQIEPLPLPTLQDIGFKRSTLNFPERIVRKSVIKQYDKLRNYPSKKGTTHLSVHLRFGTISIRQLVRIAMHHNEVWLNELIWREFYHMILWHFPQVETNSFKRPYDAISWSNNEADFLAWCEGRTGYPIVDAGMRELNATGYMHNRVRMITASFLTKHLLIDWRWGEAYFAKKLLDYDLASNNGGWQWASGSGCDAAPYFRIFNPQTQTKKFDPDLIYIRKWVPEFGSPEYPAPIIEHTYARIRALKAYKTALQYN